MGVKAVVYHGLKPRPASNKAVCLFACSSFANCHNGYSTSAREQPQRRLVGAMHAHTCASAWHQPARRPGNCRRATSQWPNCPPPAGPHGRRPGRWAARSARRTPLGRGRQRPRPSVCCARSKREQHLQRSFAAPSPSN
eukprot:349929-Chlamydomonas_euryale.AAC.20